MTGIIITPVAGSGAPGCEKTEKGCWEPNPAIVKIGEPVTFSNTDSAAHSFAAGTPEEGLTGEFNSGLIEVGKDFTFIPSKIGEIVYYDMTHVWMIGKIIVEPLSGKTAKAKLGVTTVASSELG